MDHHVLVVWGDGATRRHCFPGAIPLSPCATARDEDVLVFVASTMVKLT